MTDHIETLAMFGELEDAPEDRMVVRAVGHVLGTAAGWTVVGRHGRTNYSLMPTPVPSGMAFMVTRTPRSGN